MHNQATFTTNDGSELLVVEVSPDASNFRISKGFPDPPIGDLSYDTMLNVWQTGDVILNNGPWQLLGLLKEIKEEQAKDLACHLWDGYRNHDTIDDGTVGNYKRFVTYDANASLYSRIRSLGLDPDNKNYFLLIKTIDNG